MASSDILAALSICLAFAGAGLLAASVVQRLSNRGRMAIVNEGETMRQLRWYLRNGVRPLMAPARRLLAFPLAKEACDEAVFSLGERGFFTAPDTFLSLFLLITAVLSLFGGLVSASLAGGLAVAASLCALTVVMLHGSADKRRDALREEVPEALRCMTVCFQSGYSLMQTMQQVSAETHGPLHSLFGQAAHRMEAGQSAERALAVLRGSQGVSELLFVSVALDVQHQTGGSMVQILQSARESIEGQIEMRRSLRIQTAQAKLSARIVSIMPFLLIALFSLLSEGFLDPFFESPLGFAVLMLALGMQVAGIVMVRRVLSAETIS